MTKWSDQLKLNFGSRCGKKRLVGKKRTLAIYLKKKTKKKTNERTNERQAAAAAVVHHEAIRSFLHFSHSFHAVGINLRRRTQSASLFLSNISAWARPGQQPLAEVAAAAAAG